MRSATTNGWSPATIRRLEQMPGAALRPARRQPPQRRDAAEQSMGRWDTALEHAQETERLDPRSSAALAPARRPLAAPLRRGSAGAGSRARACAVEPPVHPVEDMTFLGEGDLAGARAVLESAARPSSPRRSWPSWRTTRISVWVLDDEQQRAAAPPDAGCIRRRSRGMGDLPDAGLCVEGRAANVRATPRRRGRPSRSSSGRRPTTLSDTHFSACRSPTSAGRRKRSGRASARSRSARSRRTP